MRKRRGESFAEFLTASLVFGIIMAGLFEFMANQTENLAMIRDRDDLMFSAQVIENWTLNGKFPLVSGTGMIEVRNHSILHNIDHDVWADIESTHKYTGGNPAISVPAKNDPSSYIENNIVKFDWKRENHTLTVKNKRTSLSFQLQPADDDS